jgi:hypothetical protein
MNVTLLGRPGETFDTPADTNEQRDPTFAACHRPWAPMTPEQLDAYRPKPEAAVPETPAQEAKRIAYQMGVSALEGIILRLQSLEREVAELRATKITVQPSRAVPSTR